MGPPPTPVPQPTPQPTPKPTPQPTHQPAPKPTLPGSCPESCNDAPITPWGWSCQNLKALGHCIHTDVQRECPHSCDACPVDACKDAAGTGTSWSLSCAWLSANG